MLLFTALRFVVGFIRNKCFSFVLIKYYFPCFHMLASYVPTNSIEELHRDVSLISPQLQNLVELHCFSSIKTSQNGSQIIRVETANQPLIKQSPFWSLSPEHQPTVVFENIMFTAAAGVWMLFRVDEAFLTEPNLFLACKQK